ncbi:hypothetical protein Tfu_0472 [Thermobifida fusca YX]|uniref:DUF6542 domain-containing protein n=1 Tax=Thermobifida fusca (strain YX) TaxID=269800 RepID=Q47SQ7_THEFY|nr:MULTISPECIES: DUF6542 domain-containing protein [Thermobifida]AAZ54510.1 hypothetical protein Tfu_0472 [Thermobifida fusca YX]MDD6791597.1 hypothetical protein [Thermobifida fusca]QOS60051.1 hypothetical protein IM867_06675 [Thermobifida fusca]
MTTRRDTWEVRVPRRSAAAPRRSASAPRHRAGASPSPPRGRVRLTARGAVLCIVLASLVSALLATAVAYPPVNGAGFVLACGLAVLTVRPQDLLTLSVSPPLAYFCGVLLAECVLSVGADSVLRSVAIGVGLRLTDAAPWLFGGTALLLVIALLRGLPQNVRELRAELTTRHRRGSRRLS